MTIPKSKSMLEQSANEEPIISVEEIESMADDDSPIKVKPIICCNEFIAILQFKLKTSIDLGEGGFKNEGMVIGVGPGISTGGPVRLESQLSIGDVVVFYGNPVLTLSPDAGVYKGDKIIIISERSVICKMAPVPFEIIDHTGVI